MTQLFTVCSELRLRGLDSTSGAAAIRASGCERWVVVATEPPVTCSASDRFASSTSARRLEPAVVAGEDVVAFVGLNSIALDGMEDA